MAKAKEIVKVGGGAIQPKEDWEIAMAQRAKDEKASEVLGVPRITHRGGVLKLDEKKIEGNKLRCAVVGYAFCKQFYKEAFDPNNPAATPVCYAMAVPGPGAEAAMRPHEAAPEKQHEQCSGCEHNRFGTAEKGRGKRCSDTRRVFVMAETGDASEVQKAQCRQISIPPGSLRAWGNYLKSLDDLTPYGACGVLTEIGTEPGEAGAYTLTFRSLDVLTKDFVKALFMKQNQIQADMLAPFPVLEATEKPKRSEKAKAKVK